MKNFTLRIRHDVARFFAEDYGVNLYADLQYVTRAKNWRNFSIFWHLVEYKGSGADMARKANKDAQSQQTNSFVWLSVPITDEFVKRATAHAKEPTDILGTCGGLVILGFAISVKPTPDGEGAMATLVKQADNDKGITLGLSAFAPDALTALSLLLVKFYDGLDEQWASTGSDGSARSSMWR